MKINYKTKKYGIIGYPIEKTLSPLIHNTYYKLNNINNVYLTFNIESNLENVISSLKLLDIKGFNVTLPYKTKILNYLDEIDETAKKIGAVNTVLISNNKTKGFNTDGLGFIKSLEANNINLQNKNILILGSGGASRSICISLLEKNIKKLYIANRTKENLERLIEDLNSNNKEKIKIQGLDIELNKLDKSNIDIIINTSSVGMYPLENRSIIDLNGFKNVIVYDVIYKPLETKLIKDAKERGFRTLNGIDMLLYQAIYSQEIWTKKPLDEYKLNLLKEKLYKNLIGG